MNYTRSNTTTDVRLFKTAEEGREYKQIAQNHFMQYIVPTLNGAEFKLKRAYISKSTSILMLTVEVFPTNGLFSMVVEYPITSIGPIGEKGELGPIGCPRGEPGPIGVAGKLENSRCKYGHNPISQLLLEDIL